MKKGFKENSTGIHGVYEDTVEFDDVSEGWGTDWVYLTDKDIEQLRAGKVIHILENGGEYQMFLRIKPTTNKSQQREKGKEQDAR